MDRAHVTERAEAHVLMQTPEGERLVLWDTPGFGDSVRLLRRLEQSGKPLGWFLAPGVGPIRRPAVLVQPAGAACRA